MRSILTGRALVIGLLAGITGAAAVLAACSSSSNTGNGSNNNNNNGDASTTQSACTNNNALSILFSPMYSAYDGTHMFQIPAVVNGIDNSAVQWSASDPSMVSIAPDTDTGGIMITVQKAGMVTINASAGGLCGSSTLNITAAQESDWELGNARYNNNIPVDRHCLGNVGGTYTDHDGGVVQCPDAGPACSNCHGPTATSQVFTDISHTPEQTGGFSDQDLINIVVNGTVPDGGYFDNSIVPYQAWQSFHNWTDIQGDQQKGIVVYLRSLTPSAQMGGANFGGHYDGGHHHDGGYGPPPNMDAGGPPPSNDSGTQGD